MSVQQISFTSEGIRCAADLYLPETRPTTRLPALVLGHSGVMVKEALADFAPHFANAGYAVLAIDYRTVGASDGEPRGQMYPERQVDDIRSAVSYLRSRDDVDPERIGTWGVSLGACVAIQAAVLDRRIKAVVGHSPSIFDGWRSLLDGRGREGFKAIRDQLELDWQRRYDTGESLRVPFLNLQHEEAHKAQEAAPKRYPTFHNEITLDSMEHMLLWAPVHFIDRLAPTPLLMISNGGYDPYHSLDQVQTAFHQAGEPKRLEVLPYDVLGLYTGPGLLEAVGLAIEWFDTYLSTDRLVGATAAPEL